MTRLSRVLAACLGAVLGAGCSTSASLPDAGATGPVLEVAAALDFGAVTVGSTNTLSLTLTNVGAEGSRLTVTPSLAAGPFSLTPVEPGTGLGPGEHLTLTVTFAPAAEGPASARLVLATNDPAHASQEVALSGAGTPSCEYDVASELLFGAVAVGESAVRPLTIRNRGQGECVLTALRVAEPAQGAFSLPDGPLERASIASGQQLEVSVRFQPAAFGLAAGTLRFSVNSARHPQAEISLGGNAPSPCLKSAPLGADFGAVGVGCKSRERTFVVKNLCESAQTLETTALGGASAAEFVLTRSPTLPLALPAGGATQLSVRYAPGGVGADEASLAITATGQPAAYLVPLQGQGAEAPSRTETFTLQSTAKVDVLFVLDDSSSMPEKQAAVATHLSRVFDSLLAQAIDFRLAVTTTSVDVVHGGRSDGGAPNENGCLVPTTSGATRVIAPETPSARATLLANAKVGGTGNEEESLLLPAVLALTEPNLGTCSAGFLREEAVLDVVVVSDAVDADTVPVAERLAALRAVKGERRAHDVVVHGIAPLGARTAQCTPEATVQPGDRLEQAVNATGGAWADVCEDWGKSLDRIAERAQAWPLQLVLQDQADPAYPLTVTVDGVDFPAKGPYGETRWQYSTPTNRLEFDPLSAPEPGAIVTVTYRLACLQ